MSGQKRGLTKALKRALKRRSAIEPHIGHMKSDGKLGRNFLKGKKGAKMNAILCAIGHNLRLILNGIEAFFGCFLPWLMQKCLDFIQSISLMLFLPYAISSTKKFTSTSLRNHYAGSTI